MNLILPVAVLAPFAVFLILGAAWLVGWAYSERVAVRATQFGLAVSGAGLLALLPAFPHGGTRVVLGDWFRAGEYHFPLELETSRLSMFPALMAVFLLALIAHFSKRYIHRDPGFHRFFLLMNLFATGILLLFTAASLDVLIAGWEMVGIASVFLIAYFQHRDQPVAGGLRAFATYRTCDLGLLVAAVVMHRTAGSATFDAIANLHGPGATAIAFLLILASLGKSAQFPFTGWLPRAMEGPTPSSAAFYGALSIHAGAFLLLRSRHLLEHAPVAAWTVVAIGAVTVAQATLSSRVAPDAKSALALGAQAQVGLIFIEIGLGWDRLALWHIGAHSLLRTLEFLRAPSVLHEYHLMHAAAGGDIPETGRHFVRWVPEGLRLRLYRLALDQGQLDAAVQRMISGTATAFADTVAGFEMRRAPVETEEAPRV